jgi:hypothetical protein
LSIFIAKTSLAQSVSPAPILDSGKFEVTVLNIYHPENPDYDYGVVRIEKILNYSHHPNAKYPALKVGIEIPVYFKWTARKITVNDLNLPGTKIGDVIVATIGGCPKENQCGNGWELSNYYAVAPNAGLNKIDNLDKKIETDPSSVKTEITLPTTNIDNDQIQTIVEFREAKLFGFIPVKIKIETVLNTATGLIEKTKKPWWAFLVI